MIVIPHSSRDQSGLGWWRWMGRVYVRCPNGHVASLDHDVDAEGTVSPSLECPCSSCDFHDNGVLEGWQSACSD